MSEHVHSPRRLPTSAQNRSQIQGKTPPSSLCYHTSVLDRRWILGGVLFASGVGLARALTWRPKLDEESRVLVIGDSLAHGMAPHFRGLAEEEDLPILTLTRPGSRIDQWVDSIELDSALDSFEPTHVLVSLGTNDAYTDFSANVIGEEAAELVQLIEEAGAYVIWIGVPDLPAVYGGRDINEESLDEIEREAPYYYESTDLEIPRGPDNLHPTAAGYAGWAGAIWGWLT